jgi:hypothetical protein
MPVTNPLTEFRADLPAPTTRYLAHTRNALLADQTAPRHGRLRIRIALAGATALSATAGLIAVTLVGAGPASAASVLDQAATAAGGQTNTAVKAGQYTFVEFTTHRQAVPNQTGASVPTTTAQEWIPVDGKGAGLIRDTSGSEIHLTDGVMVSKNPYPQEAGSVPIPIKGAPALAPLDHPSYDYLLTLPTDPAALLKVIGAQADTDRATRSREQEEFYIIAEATSHAYLPPAVRAAFYQAAALIPGVSVTEDATTGDGRHGIAVTRAESDEKLELVFDKSTHQLLGDLTLSTADGSVIEASSLTDSGIVDKVGQRP